MLASQMALSLQDARFSQLLESEKRYKLLSEELKIVKKRLEEFIDVLCHELRNPLNAIFGNKEVIGDIIFELRESVASISIQGVTSTHQVQQVVMRYMKELEEAMLGMNASSDHLKDIIDTVLTASMLDHSAIKLHSVLFDPLEMIEQVRIMFKARFEEKKITFKCVNENILCMNRVIGDPYRFKEIIINLISNAIKFTNQDGLILVTCRELDRKDHSANLNFAVKDDGIGLREEEISRMFQKFSQANEHTYGKYGGSGLGLKITREIVELMNGTICVNSEYGKGSSFEFTIPFALSQEVKKLVKKLSQSSLKRFASVIPVVNNSTSIVNESISHEHLEKRKGSILEEAVDKRDGKILIVEDNTMNQKILSKFLRLEGYSFDLAINGLEAVNLFKCNQYLLIFMDLEMPMMNGIEATKKIRQIEAENNAKVTAIVGVSANAREEHLNKALNAGMQEYITKPYLKKDILSVINKFK
ncbi:hypothetical protein AKO1_012539 [Acrasis kona]|uniref:histidine kinase n=1 Tax=Acrasis kona TaxID=1008807 RepID=A0AAW2YXF4_9EUKA